MTKGRSRVGWFALVGGVVSVASLAQAISPSLKCEALKLKLAGKYTSCRLAAVAKALKTAGSPDYTTCTTAFTAKWAIAEGRGSCPTIGDASRVHNQITVDTTNLTARLAGPRYIDNGDGTVTDTETNLMWEKKDPGSDLIEDHFNPHDPDNYYAWSSTGVAPDGDAFTEFLAQLNNCVFNGLWGLGGFAAHCDWRLPSVTELQSILDCTDFAPCIDPTFGEPNGGGFLSSTTFATESDQAWVVSFGSGYSGTNFKTNHDNSVRAVRGSPLYPTPGPTGATFTPTITITPTETATDTPTP